MSIVLLRFSDNTDNAGPFMDDLDNLVTATSTRFDPEDMILAGLEEELKRSLTRLVRQRM